MKQIDMIILCSGSFFTVISLLFGTCDALFVALLIMILLDYVSGVARAVVLKQISSKIGLVGILKK